MVQVGVEPYEYGPKLLAFKSVDWKEKPPAGIGYSPFLLGAVELKNAIDERSYCLGDTSQVYENFAPLVYRQSRWQLSVYVTLIANKDKYMEVPLEPGDTANTFITRIAECVRMLRALSERKAPNSLW